MATERTVGFAESRRARSPPPSLGPRPTAQPRRPALASPGAFDAPSKTAPGDPRSLSLSGDALDGGVPVAPSASSASSGVDWERFAARQLSRHVPVAPDGLVLSGAPRGYRLRVLAVEDYPFGPEPHRIAGRGCALEARCALSFYDEVTGSFHGATCSSLPEEVKLPVASHNPEDPDAAPVGTLDVQLDAYYTTRVADPRCLAVIELVLVERDGDRVLRETSGGWAAIPTRGADGSEPTGVASVAPVRAGSPRYLMWGRPRAGQHPPSPLGGARVLFSLEPCDAALAVAPMLPDDFPVTYGDVVPGVLRFDARGMLTSAVDAVTTTLVGPLLAPARRVAVRRARLSLPPAFAVVVAAAAAAATDRGGDKNTPPADAHVQAFLADPVAATRAVAASKCLSLRVSAHNGRRFVGPSAESDAWIADANSGAGPSIALAADVVLEDVPQDALVVLVLEVLYRAPGNAASDSAEAPACLGWGFASPFRRSSAAPANARAADVFVASDGRAAFGGGLDVREGPTEVRVRRARGPRSEPCVDWRAAARAPPEIWRALAAAARSDEGAFAVAFDVARAEGDLRPEELAARAVENAPTGIERTTNQRPAGGATGPVSGVGISAPAPAPAPASVADPSQPRRPVDPPAPPRPVPASSTSDVRARAQMDELASKMEAQMNRMEKMLLRAERSPLAPAPASSDPDQPPPAARAADVRSVEEETWPADGPAALPGDAARVLFSGGAADAREGSDDAPPPGLGGFSRATRARLHAAGADATLPPDVRLALRAGAAAERAGRDGSPPPPIDIARELSDVRAVNDVVVQFLAYRSRDVVNAAPMEETHFTFNFFDFPASASRPCALTPKDARVGEPQLLVPEGAPRNPRSFAAGASARAGEAWFNFRVDGCGHGAGDRTPDGHEAMDARRRAFVEYLAQGQLHVDVWDAKTLMQHGTCAIDLRGLLRGGRESAEILVEANVVDHRDVDADDARASRAKRAALNYTPWAELGKVTKGALLVRLINVGREPEANLAPPPGGRAGPPGRLGASSGPVRAVPESGSTLAAALKSGVRSTDADAARTRGGDGAEPRSEGDVDGDVDGDGKENARAKSLLSRRRADESGDRGVLREQEARKLARLARLREIRGGKSTTGLDAALDARDALASAGNERAVRAKMLEDIDSARRRAKREHVLRKLRSETATRVVVRPRFGETCFFEHEFKSPVDRDCVFEVRCDDPDVALVASTAEWSALRRAAGLPARAPGMEDDALAGNRLFLLAGETLRVPFKFQSFDADAGTGASEDGPQLRARTASVHFVNTEDGTSAGVLALDVRPRAVTVARTFRYPASEHEFFKTRLPPPPGVATRDEHGNTCMAVRASDPSVAVAIAGDAGDESGMAAEEITIRFKCGGPESRRTNAFYVCVYADKFLGRLVATWRVFVHAVPRVDISATMGQTAHAAMVVQGGATARRVTAFTSHRDELHASPESFELPAGALTEVNLTFRPLVPGRMDMMVHLVDTERRELVHSRLVATETRVPNVSKTFDVDLRRGARTHKKIAYTNPYPRSRTFHLRCTHPLLMHFRPERLDLDAQGTRPMGLTFEPAEEWERAMRAAGETGPAEVMVFINDEEDKTEECFRIRVMTDGAAQAPEAEPHHHRPHR